MRETNNVGNNYCGKSTCTYFHLSFQIVNAIVFYIITNVPYNMDVQTPINVLCT